MRLLHRDQSDLGPHCYYRENLRDQVSASGPSGPLVMSYQGLLDRD